MLNKSLLLDFKDKLTKSFKMNEKSHCVEEKLELPLCDVLLVVLK